MGIFSDISKDASRVVSSILGDVCAVKIRATGDTITDLDIKITYGKQVKDEFGAITAVYSEASVLKEQLDTPLDTNDIITTHDGKKFRVDQLMNESKNKWFYSVSEFG